MKISDKELQKIIQEEIKSAFEKNEIDEGFFDNLLSRFRKPRPNASQGVAGEFIKGTEDSKKQKTQTSSGDNIPAVTSSDIPQKEPEILDPSVAQEEMPNSFEEAYAYMQRKLEHFLMPGATTEQEKSGVKAFLGDLKTQLAGDLESRKAPLTLKEQQARELNISALINKHLPNFQPPAVKKLLNFIKQFTSEMGNFVKSEVQQDWGVALSTQDEKTASQESPTKAQQPQASSTSSTQFPSSAVTSASSPSASGTRTQAGTTNPETEQNIARVPRKPATSREPSQFTRRTGLSDKEDPNYWLNLASAIQSFKPDIAAKYREKASELEESKHNCSYNKLYENWKSFIKG